MEKITREEFDSIVRLSQLIEWSDRLGYDDFSDFVYEDEIDDLIDDWVVESMGNMRWYDVEERLASIEISSSETGYYERESDIDYRPILEDEFLDMKEEFLDYLLRNGLLIEDTDDEDEEFETETTLEDMLKGA